MNHLSYLDIPPFDQDAEVLGVVRPDCYLAEIERWMDRDGWINVPSCKLT